MKGNHVVPVKIEILDRFVRLDPLHVLEQEDHISKIGMTISIQVLIKPVFVGIGGHFVGNIRPSRGSVTDLARFLGNGFNDRLRDDSRCWC